MLCYAVLCYTILCHTILYYAMCRGTTPGPRAASMLFCWAVILIPTPLPKNSSTNFILLPLIVRLMFYQLSWAWAWE